MVVAIKAHNCAGVVPHGVLVRDALPAHAHPVAEQQRDPKDVVVSEVAHQVDVGVQAGEVRCAHDRVVGIHDPDVVSMALGERQRLGSIVAEVAPRAFVKLTGDTPGGPCALRIRSWVPSAEPVSTITHELM